MGILYKTKCYLIGAIENDAQGLEWRQKIEDELKDTGIVFLNPYNKPFLFAINETEEFKQKLRDLRQYGRYDELAAIVKQIRREDLSLVDRSDFVIFYYDITKPTCGSWEESFLAVKIKRPVFIIIKQGKKQCPIWLFGCLPHKYIYSSEDEVIDVLKKIDGGNKTLDSDRWRLLNFDVR